MIDYKGYMEMFSPGQGANEGEEAAAKERGDEGKTTMSKIAPYGAEEVREVMVLRKQAEQARLREERLRRQAYKEALDVRIFEEELEASRARKGGANPAITTRVGIPGSLSCEVSVADFKFSTNQYPIRFVAAGKCSFLPIDFGTAADRPVKPMTCRGQHELEEYTYYWQNCDLCRKQGTAWSCWSCYFHVCASCLEGDKRFREQEKRDCTKLPTFLRCSNICSFTLQIPTHGGADAATGRFSLSLEVRFARLPPAGHLQSLLRFPLPDLAQARRLHRTSVYLNPDGRVVARPLVTGGEVDGSKAKVRAGWWVVITLSVDPAARTLSSYVNGDLCHVATDLEPADFRLQHKLVVLGGGKQAHARGGDVRRIMVHNDALDAAGVQSVFSTMATDNPGVGGRLVKLQALYRGYKYRKVPISCLWCTKICPHFFQDNNIILKENAEKEDKDDGNGVDDDKEDDDE
jgi:hypothetical protein